MPTTSTIDQHAVNRAKMIERLASTATDLGFTASDLVDPEIRCQLEAITKTRPSPTTWACLVIRLGGPSEPDPVLSPAEVERTVEYVALIEDALEEAELQAELDTHFTGDDNEVQEVAQ